MLSTFDTELKIQILTVELRRFFSEKDLALFFSNPDPLTVCHASNICTSSTVRYRLITDGTGTYLLLTEITGILSRFE
jgi:hypothetical protein